MLKRLVAVLCAVAMLCGGMTVSASGGGTVLYDEDSGENLSALLAEDDTAWPTVAVPDSAAGLTVNAKGAVLMEQGSGEVLYEQGAKEHLPIASVTKVMTLLLVMEAIEDGRLKWGDTVTCSAKAASMGGSQIWLEQGEVMTVEELVKAAAVVSANDACAALAEHISGTLEAFVAAMNARAKALGMNDTNFVDCSGLDDSGFSCAYDVAVMSRELMKHTDIQKYTTIWMDSLRGGKSQLVNTNKLVRHYKGATGLKTGTTQAAGHCLSATATRNGTSFVAVVLGCATTADRFDGARAMLDYGFSNYVSYTPPAELMQLAPIPVLNGQADTVEIAVDMPQSLLLKKGTESTVEPSAELAVDLEAPVHAGQVVGTWKLKSGDQTLCEYAVRATADVPAKTFRYAYSLLVAALLA